MKNGLIITGGSISRFQLEQLATGQRYDVTIVVDGALKIAIASDLKIDYLVGDFDTIEPAILNEYEKKIKSGECQTELIRLIPEKDMTDTQVAIDLAIDKGVTDLTILGGIGTRVDHSLANIHLLLRTLRNGVNGCMINEWNRIRLVDRNIAISKEDSFGKYISLIPFTTKVTGITLKGMKYPLKDHTLVLGDSLGISNEITSEVASIELEEGILLMIESCD
ncbi:thiamin pyrophosphokinase [Lachnospiraceae bacterium KM106-2]|nr:thiamin pyrophosphokinase [Lachnospiraceae bacterium KM106-2]